MQREAFAGAGLLEGAAVHGRPTLKLLVYEGLHLMERIHGAGGVCEELQSIESMLERFMKDFALWKAPNATTGEEYGKDDSSRCMNIPISCFPYSCTA